MERKLEVGQHVRYTDHQGREHDALVTADWSYSPLKSVNLVYVSADDAKEDPYGRQIERDTSVPHKSCQAAPGNFWRWPDEE